MEGGSSKYAPALKVALWEEQGRQLKRSILSGYIRDNGTLKQITLTHQKSFATVIHAKAQLLQSS